MPAETLGCGEAEMSSPSPARLTDWQMDVEAAAMTDVPVLISGRAADSAEFVRYLSRLRSPESRVTIVHCGRAAATKAIAGLTRTHRQTADELLLLQEVEALSAGDQLFLEQQLESALLCEGRGVPVRVLASSSGRLFKRVLRGQFRERLFYLLNMIHIELPPGSERD